MAISKAGKSGHDSVNETACLLADESSTSEAAESHGAGSLQYLAPNVQPQMFTKAKHVILMHMI